MGKQNMSRRNKRKQKLDELTGLLKPLSIRPIPSTEAVERQVKALEVFIALVDGAPLKRPRPRVAAMKRLQRALYTARGDKMKLATAGGQPSYISYFAAAEMAQALLALNVGGMPWAQLKASVMLAVEAVTNS